MLSDLYTLRRPGCRRRLSPNVAMRTLVLLLYGAFTWCEKGKEV
jgi:hypothetical protein